MVSHLIWLSVSVGQNPPWQPDSPGLECSSTKHKAQHVESSVGLVPLQVIATTRASCALLNQVLPDKQVGDAMCGGVHCTSGQTGTRGLCMPLLSCNARAFALLWPRSFTLHPSSHTPPTTHHSPQPHTTIELDHAIPNALCRLKLTRRLLPTFSTAAGKCGVARSIHAGPHSPTLPA